MRILRGRCECRAVAYEVEDDFLYALNCRRPSARFAGAPLSASGTARFARLRGPSRGMPRPHMSGAAFGVSPGSHALGSLVDAPSLTPTAHIFVGSKAPWYEILDDLPQHEEYG